MARQRIQLTDQDSPDQAKAQLGALDWASGPFDVVITSGDDRVVLDDQSDADLAKAQLDALDWSDPRDVTVQLNEP